MSSSDLESATHTTTRVSAFARLHMGFIDPSGTLGRNFGSIGVAVNHAATQLEVAVADELRVSGPDAERVKRYAEHYCQALKLPARFHIRINQVIPSHVGLGSGTQLALATGAVLDAYFDQQHSVREIAKLTGRRARSGIGIATFENGGLVVDGGLRPNAKAAAPVVARLAMPRDWRFILVSDQRGTGLHGQHEIDAFKALPVFPQANAAALAHSLLMKGLPALVEEDIETFGQVISQLQQAVGEYFAPVQGGVFTSPLVAKAIATAEALGAVGAGQTSWGPTGFCLAGDDAAACKIVLALKEEFKADPELEFAITSPRNEGAEVTPSHILED